MDELKIDKAVPKDQETAVETETSTSFSEWKGLLIVVGVLAGIFILSLLGLKLYNNVTAASVVNVDELHQQNLGGELDTEEGYIYNGYSFVYTDGLWWTEMNKFGTLLKIPLHFGPKELEDIPVRGKLDPAFNDGLEIYLAIDPEVRDKYYSLALSELSFNVVKGLDRKPVGSCTENDWACDNRTIISCQNNTQNQPVVELALSEGSAKIEAIGTCLKVTGNGYDIVKAVDRLLYKWYG